MSETFGDHLHWRAAANARGWTVLLPGAGGLRVLDDDQHYFRAAARLNARGWHALVVDYVPAYRALEGRPDLPAGRKIAAVIQRAIEWMHVTHPETRGRDGALIGWSRGAEGVAAFVDDAARVSALGIRAAAVFYPSVPHRVRLDNQVPLLVLTGTADDVAPWTDVSTWVRGRTPTAAAVDLRGFDGAHHGFDVESLTRRRVVRLLPLVGPKATLQFHPAAARLATMALEEFLAAHLPRP
ncbi:MAG: dienelactone hydrolase family protein [Vicinamibacterales bacterium]